MDAVLLMQCLVVVCWSIGGQGNRRFMFNFMGSMGTGKYLKPDRLLLKQVVENHDWEVRCTPSHSNALASFAWTKVPCQMVKCIWLHWLAIEMPILVTMKMHTFCRHEHKRWGTT